MPGVVRERDPSGSSRGRGVFLGKEDFALAVHVAYLHYLIP